MRRAALRAGLVLLAACGPAYREPPAREPRPAPAESGPTVVGHVTPEGRVVADTLAEAVPDTVPVDRETVMTGVVRPAEEPAPVSRAGEELPAGSWRVQVLAARDEPTATAAARRVESEIGAPAAVVHEGGWFKVQVGGFAERGDAEALRSRLVGRGYVEAFVLRVAGS